MNTEQERRIRDLEARLNERVEAGKLDELITLLRDAQRWVELSTVLEMRAQLANEPRERASALLEKARVEYEELADIYAARQTYARVVEIAPDADEARARIADIRQQIGE
jgi:hypothetical protein